LWIAPDSHPLLQYLCKLMLYVSALLTLWSMITYLRAAWPEMRR